MSMIATRFVSRIRQNIESWRAREMDHITFNGAQQDIWAAVRAAGSAVEAEVVDTLQGVVEASDLSLATNGRPTVLRLDSRRSASNASTRPCHHYYALITHIKSESMALCVAPTDPHGPCAEHRQIAALVYELAADLERQSLRLGAQWEIVADPDDRRLVVLLDGDHESELAYELLESLITRYELIDAR